ncbi:CoA pyrophosphatase [Glaciecola sp. MH2013]|uniref:CoA pyrophosphatase n=1 Tax=Glaciecola sp. MH2013 TaxID=2785524 RepID=UPI00189E5E17|nr:CoA pyrophosphatase [Glaciecola sp. MH2013]MBF7072733.1 CoA pyrophosphatase [Glaciecola sp. MH2013]
MNEKTFLSTFHLPWAAGPAHDFPYPIESRPAAVLICLQPPFDDLQVLFTERASHLTHHAGQISFPGGKYEQSDDGLIATALREAEEEIGLNANDVRILGTLPEYKTISGFTVLPVVGILDQCLCLDKDLNIDRNEVSRVFQVPLAHLMNKSQYFTHEVKRKNYSFPVYFIQYENDVIWGATAGMTAALCKHFDAYKHIR